MKKKLLILSLLVASSFVYLEWGGNNNSFLFQAEIEILYRLFTDPVSIVHPFILLPFGGQILLCIALLQKKPNPWIFFFGVIGLLLLIGFVFGIGLMVGNTKIIYFSLPYLILTSFAIYNFKKEFKSKL